jgi:hypothetical protein
MPHINIEGTTARALLEPDDVAEEPEREPARA